MSPKVSCSYFPLSCKNLHLQFVYTAEAPASLITQYNTLTAGPGGALLRAATEQLMGADALGHLLWVTCSGEGAGGGLAILCGVHSALQYPLASVDVITFATPWASARPLQSSAWMGCNAADHVLFFRLNSFICSCRRASTPNLRGLSTASFRFTTCGPSPRPRT